MTYDNWKCSEPDSQEFRRLDAIYEAAEGIEVYLDRVIGEAVSGTNRFRGQHLEVTPSLVEPTSDGMGLDLRIALNGMPIDSDRDAAVAIAGVLTDFADELLERIGPPGKPVDPTPESVGTAIELAHAALREVKGIMPASVGLALTRVLDRLTVAARAVDAWRATLADMPKPGGAQ